MAEKLPAFELILIHRTTDVLPEILSYDIVKANDLIQLLAQFNMLVLTIARKENERIIQQIRMADDDIPF